MIDVTRILNAIEKGDVKASDELLPLVYEELRLLAAQRLSNEKPGQTLQATALVHEAYIKLVGSDDKGWDSSGHFFAAAAEAMRRILIENARKKSTLKRGGSGRRLDFEDLESPFESAPEEIMALDEALKKLSEEDGALTSLVKLRYFAGMTVEQIAMIRNISSRTVFNHLSYARAWLRRELEEPDRSASQ